MSILNPVPQAPKPTHAMVAADNIKRQARDTFQSMTKAFNSGARLFWANSLATPQQIAEALGTDAKEVFELHGKLGALIASVKPESIAVGAAVVGQFQYNEDGSVTVVTPPESSSPSSDPPQE